MPGVKKKEMVYFKLGERQGERYMYYSVSGTSYYSVPGVSNRTFGDRTHSKIWSIEQNQTFDYRTVDNRTKSNVRLPNSQRSYSIERSITELLFVYIADILNGAQSP